MLWTLLAFSFENTQFLIFDCLSATLSKASAPSESRAFQCLRRLGVGGLWWIEKLEATSVSPFIVAISALIEHRCSLISRPDLFCNGKYLVAPIFETSVQQVFKGFLWLFKLSYNKFQLLPGWIKNRTFKNWIHFSFNFG